MSKISTIEIGSAVFATRKFIVESLTKLGKKFDANGVGESVGISAEEHVKMIERGINEIGSLFADQNDPQPAERHARCKLLTQLYAGNTSQFRQVLEAEKLLVKAEGSRASKPDALALLD